MNIIVSARVKLECEDEVDSGFYGNAHERVWKPDDPNESLSWYGSSDDEEPPPRAVGVSLVGPRLAPGPPPPSQPGRVIWRVHLSASRIAMWLGMDSFGWDGRCKGSVGGRQRLVDDWSTPRARTKTGRPNPRLERGKQHEPLTRKRFAELAGLEIGVDITKSPLVEHPLHPHLAAKADGLIGTEGVLEIKTPWSARADLDAPLELEVKHLLQVMLQLECYNRAYAIVVMSACDGEWLHVWRINRDAPEVRRGDGGPATPSLFELCLPEFEKYRQALEDGGVVDRVVGGISEQKLGELRQALRSWASFSVFKLGLEREDVLEDVLEGDATDRWPHKRLAGWVAANVERANRPGFTVIDGVQRPQDGARIERTKDLYKVRRFTRIWWRHDGEGRAHVYHPRGLGTATSGGYIRPEYYHALLDNPDTLKDRTLWIPNRV